MWEGSPDRFYRIGQGDTSKVPLQKYFKCFCFHDFWGYITDGIKTKDTINIIELILFSNFNCVESSGHVYNRLNQDQPNLHDQPNFLLSATTDDRQQKCKHQWQFLANFIQVCRNKAHKKKVFLITSNTMKSCTLDSQKINISKFTRPSVMKIKSPPCDIIYW